MDDTNEKIVLGLAAMLLPPAILTAELISNGMATPLIGLGAAIVCLGTYLVIDALGLLDRTNPGGK